MLTQQVSINPPRAKTPTGKLGVAGRSMDNWHQPLIRAALMVAFLEATTRSSSDWLVANRDWGSKGVTAKNLEAAVWRVIGSKPKELWEKRGNTTSFGRALSNRVYDMFRQRVDGEYVWGITSRHPYAQGSALQPYVAGALSLWTEAAAGRRSKPIIIAAMFV